MRALARFDAGFDGDRRHLPDLRFGDAMRLFGMTARALRLYEERGLVEARRDPMNRRYYDALARKKLARIASLRTAGLSLNEIREILAADDALALLAGAGVPAGRVYTAADMVADAHYAAREMVLRRTARAGFELPMTGIVPRFSRTPGAVRDVGPGLGEHTEEVRTELAGAGSAAAGSAR